MGLPCVFGVKFGRSAMCPVKRNVIQITEKYLFSKKTILLVNNIIVISFVSCIVFMFG